MKNSQNLKLAEKMEEAYWLCRNRLFCEKTGLVYDSLSSLDPIHRFDHHPTEEEILLQIPNPAGWGTGMEDSMLNAGSVVEACILRARLEPEKRAETLTFVREILRGMKRCATVHEVPGFVARSCSIHSGKSCYINSSRDQFTLYVYGLWRFYHCEFVTEQEQREIASLLRATADYCEKAIQPETENNLLRLDGQPGLVSQMLNIEPHEAFRLPMFYLAAADVTGDAHYYELYERYAPDALAETLAMDTTRHWWNLQLVQMQISLALAMEADQNSERLRQIRQAMQITARLAEEHLPEEEEKMQRFAGDWSALAAPWHEAWKFTIREDSLRPNAGGLFYGRLYLKPWERESFMEAFELIRAIGNLTVTIMLCKEHVCRPELIQGILRAAAIPDYRHHTSGGVCNILHGYYLLKKQMCSH